MIVLVTGGFDHKLRFWEASSGVCSRALRCPGDGQINCLAVSSDKQLLVAGGNPHISLFDVNSNSDAPLVSFDGHTSNVTAVGFQRDGKWLYSGSEDGTVRIWDPRSSVSQRCFETSPLSPVHTVALHPNQTDLLAGDQAGSVRVWDLEANACRHKHALGEQPVRSLSIACDASIVAVGSHKGRVTILESTDNRTLSYKTHFQAHDEYLLRCVLSPDTRTLATASADKTVKLWSTQSWECEMTLAQHQRWVWDVVFSADSQYLVSASSDQSAKLWDLKTGEVVRNLTGHNLAVTCVALNDGTVQ